MIVYGVIDCYTSLTDLIPNRQVHRGMQHHLAFLLGGLDQLRRDRYRRRHLGAGGACEYRRQRKRARASENIASRNFYVLHRVLCQSHRVSARQRSGGSVSQTSMPLATAFSVEVTTRKELPSEVSTM